MRSLLILAAVLTQFGQRPSLTPAETLLEPSLLESIRTEATREDLPVMAKPVTLIEGTDAGAGEIVIGNTQAHRAAMVAMQTLRSLVEAKRLPRPTRTIRLVPSDGVPPAAARTAILLRGMGASASVGLFVIRNLWANASITDEVVDLFIRQFGRVDSAEMNVVDTRWEALGVPTTMIVYANDRERSAAIAAAASAYFLATLPNAGAEALLSHLTVGAHARLAEDARKAVAQMGNQQRAGADVLIMFGQAIEREQRRMRSFENYMPAPIDPTLHSRILDMEKGITSVWTSMGLTSSPFVPAAQRIRGRGGEDRRIVVKVGTGLLPAPEPSTALLKFQNSDVVIYELGNFIDGLRSISDIRDAVSAEFEPIAVPVVVDYFERLAKTGAVSLR